MQDSCFHADGILVLIDLFFMEMVVAVVMTFMTIVMSTALSIFM